MPWVSFARRIIPKRLKALLKAVTGRDSIRSYSQFGEDAFLAAYFRAKTWVAGKNSFLPRQGFYVDIGAYSPTECSNTYLFYRHGWRGINVEAQPGVIEGFRLIRSRDINLNVAAAQSKGELTFYSWGSPSVFNTADPELAKERARSLGKQPIEITVRSIPLREILDEYLPSDTKINFLSVDVEGLDLEVLKSNNWDKYRPELIVAEAYKSTLEKLKDSELYVYLRSQDYKCIAWIAPSVIFRDVRNAEHQ
jgi:FkbM family methyltransferase